MTEEPSLQSRQREFWDAQSRWNTFVAIYDNADTRDPERGGEAFWRAGELDARRLQGFFAPGARVLDLGCGIGRVLFFLAPRAGEAIGADVSHEMLARARQAFAGVPNTRFLETSGAALAGVETGSIDFLYSLLCLIHVDRRSAYRYLEEIRRVLRPGGKAFLQYHDIATPEGLAKFRTVLDRDDPLEFYTLEELRFLFASVGLEIATSFGEAEYLYFTVIHGDARAWRERLAASVRAEDVETSPGGDLSAVLCSDLPAVEPLRLELSAARAGRVLSVFDALVDLPPGRSRLEVRRADPLAEPKAHLDGRRLDLVHVGGGGDTGSRAPLEFHAALLPAGFRYAPDFLASFPGLACAWKAG
jgi:SAM-dependent methyltransferase